MYCVFLINSETLPHDHVHSSSIQLALKKDKKEGKKERNKERKRKKCVILSSYQQCLGTSNASHSFLQHMSCVPTSGRQWMLKNLRSCLTRGRGTLRQRRPHFLRCFPDHFVLSGGEALFGVWGRTASGCWVFCEWEEGNKQF